MPRLVACGGRGVVFEDFKTAYASAGANDFIAMLIDSEDPVADSEATWVHLHARDRRSGAFNDHLHGNMDSCGS